jgi:hypothetical protein
MGYVGNQSTNAYSSLPAKQDLTGATGTSLTLSHAVAGPESIDLFINNVRQEPTTAYSVSDTTVTLTGSVVASDDIYVVYNGLALQTIVPPDGSVSTAKIADDAVTSAKLDTNIAVAGDLTVDTDTLHVDSTNNSVGIGASSPIGKLMVKDGTSSPSALVVRQTSEGGSAALSLDSIFNNASNTDKEIASIKLGVVTNGGATPNADIRFETMQGGTLSEAMRIQSNGTISLGKTDTTASTPGFFFNKNSNGFGTQSGGPVLYLNRTTTTGTNLQFRMNNSPVGAVNVTATSTSYATSSDYRLKENVTDMTGATDRLKQLNPVRFNFIVDADTTVDGFLAHEVQSVVPEAITGTHNEVDADGNPEYQGIDQSKLVPLLVATIQEQQTAIEALTARVTALEAN